MNTWYQRVVLPRLLNSEMGAEALTGTRRKVLKDALGVVLEIGVGPGYNLPLYTGIEKLYALEPSQELTNIAKTRMSDASFPVEFLTTGAEHILLPENSVDTVVSTWTLCSVSDPNKVLSEIKRVLKPGGRFLFAEHGASPNRFLRMMQSAFTFVTKHFTGNCHYDRDIGHLITEAGFEIERINRSPEKFKPLLYNYQGSARVRD